MTDTPTSSGAGFAWGRAILPRDAETLAAQTAIQPHIAFELEREDKRGWNWDPVEGDMVKPKLSFNKARRYNIFCAMKMAEHDKDDDSLLEEDEFVQCAHALQPHRARA